MQSMKSVYLCAIVLAIVIRPNAAFKFDYVSGDRRVQEGVEIRLLSLVSGGGQLSNNSWKICKWMRGQNICEFQWACKGIGCAIAKGTIDNVHPIFEENPKTNQVYGCKISTFSKS
ncbi:uncharacterized protein [Lepeophtheirus salmonis]|uniref:uncharacterized protein isoform X2 n=1 Tax=Lepeophtheirus salmonis TaxID=72036 RepID=UPI003AF3538D